MVYSSKKAAILFETDLDNNSMTIGTFYSDDGSNEGLTLARVPVIDGYDNLMNYVLKIF